MITNRNIAVITTSVRQQCGGRDSADDLCDHIGRDLSAGKASASSKADGDGWVEMTTGDVPDGVGHRHHTQAKRQRYAEQSDADFWKCRRDDRASAACESQPKCPDGFCGVFPRVHLTSPENF
jgi:hypothetical protein